MPWSGETRCHGGNQILYVYHISLAEGTLKNEIRGSPFPAGTCTDFTRKPLTGAAVTDYLRASHRLIPADRTKASNINVKRAVASMARRVF